MMNMHQLSTNYKHTRIEEGAEAPAAALAVPSAKAIFPHAQLVHLSYAAQTIGLALRVCMLMQAHLRRQQQQAAATFDGGHAEAKASTGRRARHKQSGRTTAANGAGVGDSVESRVDDLVSVLCQTPASLERLLADLHTMLADCEHPEQLVPLDADDDAHALLTRRYLHPVSVPHVYHTEH